MEKKRILDLISTLFHAKVILKRFEDFMVDLSHTQVPKLKEKLLKSISSYMKEKGLSQGAVGRLTGLDRRNVNEILCKKVKGISLDRLIRIANGIGLKVELIIKKKKSKRSKDS